MVILEYLLFFLVIVGVLLVVIIIMECINQKMLDNYKDMINNSEKSDAKDRKKSTFFHFNKK